MDERLWASEVPSAYSNIEPIYYAPSDQEVAECFDAVSKAHDVPITSSLVLSSYFVMKLAAERGVKVVLDGTGADTLSGGRWSPGLRDEVDWGADKKGSIAAGA